MTRASILIPIHNKPSTLPLTVDTVLRQSEPDLEVLLIGDGVTDEVRDVVAGLVRDDERVRFLDLPKGPHHGERYRHDAILAANSEAIFYLCDDDLLLPDHVADLLALLDEHDLVQSLNGYVNLAGGLRLYAADLSDPGCVSLHLSEEVQFCSVSITGTAHTRSAYLRVSRWDTTPAGQWPDHWQFRKLMALPGFRGATSARMTALQFPTSGDGRDSWTDEERVAELVPWHRRVTSPGAQEEIDQGVREGMLSQLIEERAQIALLRHEAERHGALWKEQQAAIEKLEIEQVEAAGLRLLVAEQAGALEDLQRHADGLSVIRAEREAKIESLRERLDEKGAKIQSQRERLASKNAEIARLRDAARSPR